MVVLFHLVNILRTDLADLGSWCWNPAACLCSVERDRPEEVERHSYSSTQSGSSTWFCIWLGYWCDLSTMWQEILLIDSVAYALVAHLNWRWAFYLGVIANGFALSLIVIFYWPPNFLDLHLEDGKTRLDQLKELDFVGLLLSGGGLTCFLLGVSWGNNPYPWTGPHVLAPLIIGGELHRHGYRTSQTKLSQHSPSC